jgi:hypothetical protein
MTTPAPGAELRTNRDRLANALEVMAFALDCGEYGVALASERTAMQLLETIARATETAQLAQATIRTGNGNPLAAVTQLHPIGQP